MSCVFSTLESGTIIRADAGRDISDNTDLRIVFTRPDGTTITKSVSGGEVTLGTSDEFDESLNETLLANQFAKYSLELGLFDVAGDKWERQLWLDKTTVSPELHQPGRTNVFTVVEG